MNARIVPLFWDIEVGRGESYAYVLPHCSCSRCTELHLPIARALCIAWQVGIASKLGRKAPARSHAASIVKRQRTGAVRETPAMTPPPKPARR